MNSNNNNMNGSQNNKTTDSSNKPKNVTVNHYHYYGEKDQKNKHHHRQRNNNRGKKNNKQYDNNLNNIKQQSNIFNNPYIKSLSNNPIPNNNPIINNSLPNINPVINSPPNNIPKTDNSKSHIILRSSLNPNNMKIIPVNNNFNPFLPQQDSLAFLKMLFGEPDKNNDKVNNIKNDKEDDENQEYVELNNVIDLDTLIKVGEEYDINDKRKYPIDMKKLKNIVKPLKELKNVIGMESVKKNIFEQLLFILQDLNDSNMMHTVIEGPPGVGKTLLGKILAKIYCKLEFLKKNEINKDEKDMQDITNQLLSLISPTIGPQPKKETKENKEDDDFKFKVVRRSDLIGQFVGSTAIKTQKVIDEAAGGVLFIDEAYSLGSGGSNDRADSFSKECIDTLNQNLSENGDKFICIIAGYPSEIERCFFSQNEGLRRRFPFKYTIEKYTSKELSEIFNFKVKDIKWEFSDDLKLVEVEKFIDKHKKHFEHFGGDIETLLLNIKIKHSTRVFGKHPSLRKKITMEDIKLAFEEFHRIRKEKELPQFVKDLYC